MEKTLSREDLMRRIAELEAELDAFRENHPPANASQAIGLSDLEDAADGICVCHAIQDFPHVHFTFWNRRMVALTGYDRETINRRGWYQSVYPDPEVQARAIARMKQMREGVNLEAETWEVSRADGKRRMVRITTFLLDHGSPNPRVMAIMHDVTELRSNEQALQQERRGLQRQVHRQSERLAAAENALTISDARYRALFEIAGDALFVEDDQDRILDVNQKACDLLGYDRQELLTKTVDEIQAPECRGQRGRILSEEVARHRGKPFETVDLHKDGTRIPVEVTNTRLEKAGLFLCIVRDIRPRLALEQAHRETFAIIEESPVVVFLWRNQTNWPVEFVTTNVERIFGYADADFLSGRILYRQVVHPDDRERVDRDLASHSRDTDRTEFCHRPYRIVARDGSTRWVSDQTLIRRDETGRITHFQGIVEDITSRIAAEQALTVSEEKFSKAFHSSPDAIIITRLQDSRILEVNEGFIHNTGYQRDEVIGRSTDDLKLWANPNDRQQYAQMIAQTGSVRNVEYRFRIQTGEIRDGLVSAEVIQIGNQKCLLGTIRDITDQKLAEAVILREKHFSEAIINQMPGSFYMFSENGRMMRWSDRLREVTGYSDAEIEKMNALDFFAADEKEHVYEKIQEVFVRGKSQVEANFLTKNGQKIPHLLTGAKIVYDGMDFLAGVGLDITEDKQVKNALKESEERFRQITDNINEVFWLFDWQEQRVLYVSPAYELIWGRSREALYENYGEWGGSIHPEDVPHAQETFNRILETGGGEPREYRVIRPDGAERWIADTGYAIKDENGAIVRVTGIAEDITERKQTEDALNREKERLAVTLKSIGDAVISTDRKGCIVLMNPVAEKLTGWTEAAAQNRPLMEVFRIVNEQTREPQPNPVEKVLATGQIVELANHTLLVAKNGQEHVIADSGAPIRNREGQIIGVVLVFRDITNQQRTEKELLKMEKLKSLGVLAGGIAHDFNNFLTGIIGNLSLAKLDVQPGNPVSRALNEMEKAALRAKDLTQQLLTFSKGGEPVKQTIRIADVVRESAQFALHGSNVRCQIDLDENLLPADVDEGQIAQVVHNLIINADQAMPDGGAIRIQGANVNLAAANAYALAPGKYIELSIRDEGIGIHPEYRKKIFDPYFTTKQKGSGLGLAVAYSIIAKHDGQLTVESQLGQGTTFTLMLPAVMGSQLAQSDPTRQLVAGSGRVLVMDDEDFIRDLATAMLRKMGYEVTVAPDGQAAVSIYQEALEAGRTFDAVILDLTVPGGMGGKDTLQQLKSLDPTVKAIVSSGYSNDPVMANHSRFGFCAAVKKPYLVEEMSRVLDTVIKR